MHKPTSVMTMSRKIQQCFTPDSDKVQNLQKHNLSKSPEIEPLWDTHTGRQENQKCYYGPGFWSFLQMDIQPVALGL